MTIRELEEAKARFDEARLGEPRTWEYGIDEGPPPIDEVGPTMCPCCGIEWLDDDWGVGYPPLGLSIYGGSGNRPPYIEWLPCCECSQGEVSYVVGVGDEDEGFRHFYGISLIGALRGLTGRDIVEVSEALDWAVSERLTIYDPTEVGDVQKVEVGLWVGGRPAGDTIWLDTKTPTEYHGQPAQLGEWKPGSKVEALIDDTWQTIRVRNGAHFGAISPPGWRDAAFALVREHHARLPKVHGYKFAIGCFNGPVETGTMVGIAIVSRPLARRTQQSQPGTLEVTRVATWGELRANASSKLYAACAERARSLGYDKLITATHRDESGHSLHAAGWRIIHVRYRVDKRGWERQQRERGAPVDPIGKTRWALGLTKTAKRAVRREAEHWAIEDEERRRELFRQESRIAMLYHWAHDIDKWEEGPYRAAKRALLSYLSEHGRSDMTFWRLTSETGASSQDLQSLADLPWEVFEHKPLEAQAQLPW